LIGSAPGAAQEKTFSGLSAVTILIIVAFLRKNFKRAHALISSPTSRIGSEKRPRIE
jgi:hypothetical protein